MNIATVATNAWAILASMGTVEAPPPPPLPPPPAPIVTTTTTTVPPPPITTTTTSVPPRTAASAVGLGYADIGSDGQFWCTDLIAWLYSDVDLGDDPGPTNAARAFPVTDAPQPGDVVLIDLMWDSGVGHDPNHPTHVAILVGFDGDNVHMIEANGASRTHVVESTWHMDAVIGYRSVH